MKVMIMKKMMNLYEKLGRIKDAITLRESLQKREQEKNKPKPVKEATVEMVKGTSSNTNCADKCYGPNTVTVAVGGKVTWKNVDTAAHSATAMDSSFDTSLVNAGASASNTFNTAGTYQYMCIVHPWMKGTVIVK